MSARQDVLAPPITVAGSGLVAVGEQHFGPAAAAVWND